MFTLIFLIAQAHATAIVTARTVLWTNVRTSGSGPSQSANVTVDFNGQTWEGWGVALAWWAYMFGDDTTNRADLKSKNWESDHNEALLAGIFYNPRHQDDVNWDKWVDIGKTANGNDKIEVPKLGFNIVRYNIGGSCGQQYRRSNASMGVTYNEEVFEYDGKPVDAACTYATANGQSKFQVAFTQPFKRMQTPKRTPTEWDWSKDNAQTQVLFRAKYLGADIFELFANSAPWWMNHDNRVLPKDDPPANPNDFSFLFKVAEQRSKVDFYNNFAQYLIDVYNHFGGNESEESIKFNAISPINEPSELRGELFAVPRCYWRENSNNGQEGACYLPEEKRKMIHAMKDKILQNPTRDITLSVADENVMSLGTAFIQDLLQYDRVALRKIDRVGVHGYATCKTGRESLQSAWKYAKSTGDFGNARLWNSETGDGDHWCDDFDPQAGLSNGLETVRNLMLDLHQLRGQMTAYNYWQVMDEANGWGMAKMDPNHLPFPSVLQANWKWFTMAHFSRHIRPGMRVLAIHAFPETPSPGEDAETFVLMAGRFEGESAPNLKKLALVILNANAISQTSMSLDLAEVLPAGAAGWTRREWVTSASGGHEMRYEEVGEKRMFSGTVLQVEQRAWSVTTIELDSATSIPEQLV